MITFEHVHYNQKKPCLFNKGGFVNIIVKHLLLLLLGINVQRESLSHE